VEGDKTPGVTRWKAGNHAFRRFRDTYLRNEARTPDGIIKYWMGHDGKDMTDLYDKAGTWRKTRRDEAERAGIGFALPKKSVSCTDCTEKTKTAAGVAAV
jgi:integrase